MADRCEVVAATPFFRVEKERRRLARAGREIDVYRICAPDWVNVVALTPALEVVLVRQPRFGTGESSLEIPGGVVDPGESPEAAAVRELEEETGYRGRPPVALGWVHPNPAILDNRMHAYLVADAALTGTFAPDEDEEIVVETRPLHDLRRLVREGAVTHALVVASLYLLDAHLARGGGAPG